MKNKVLSIILTIAMTFSLVVAIPSSSASAISRSDVVSKLQSLMNQYVGKTATKAQMYQGSQCKGFANWVFLQIFGVYIGGYPENAKYKINTDTSDLLGELAPGSLNESSCRELLSKGAPGDYIQVQRSTARGSGPHSMILVDVNNSGIEVFDCNSDGKNSIKRYTITWSQFDVANKGMSLLRAKGYNPGSSSEPLTPDGNYSRFMPLISYLSVSNNIRPCNSDCSSETGGAIYPTDRCVINEVYTNGWCKVTYPISGGTRVAYTQISNFIPSTNSGFAQKTAPQTINAYSRADLSNNIGNIDTGDNCYLLGTSGGSTQVIYPTSGGYKLGWTSSGSWNFIAPGTDDRFNPYCPIKGYLKNDSTIKVYNSDFSSLSGGEIWGSDYCSINAVYSNGWCQVTYPTSSGNKTAYTPLSSFVYDTSVTPVSYKANSQINVYTRSDMSNTPKWWISSGDTFFKISTVNNVTQVMYPIDAQYGGGYKIGWIYTSELPITTYAVRYDANGGTGAPSNQTKKYDENLTLSSTIPTRNGYTFAGWSTSNSSSNVEYTSGAIYTKNSAITLYAVWVPNKYEIKYDLNGGYGVIDNQTKEYGKDLSLSNVTPEKSYYLYLVSSDKEDENTVKTLNCKFLGWSTSKTATSPSYNSGEKFTNNENTTLYAVWSNPTVGDLPTVSKSGYTFAGWYSSESGGTKIIGSTVVNSDMTYYARWNKNQVKEDAPTFILSGKSAKIGSTFTVDVSIKNNPGITSLNVVLDYPTNTFTLTNVEYKDLFSSKATGSNKLTSPFIMSWFSSKSENEKANGVLATLTFSVSENAEKGTYPINLTYDKENVFDSSFNNIDFDIANAEISVTDSIPGDVNGDTKVNMKDIVLIQQYLNGWDVKIDENAANVNGDKTINMKDVVLLQQYLNGWKVELK